MSYNYEDINRQVKIEKSIKLKDLCEQNNWNYNSVKNGLARYRRSLQKSNQETNQPKGNQSSRPGEKSTRKKTAKTSPRVPRPRKKQITVSDLIALAEKESKLDPSNLEYQSFLRRAKSKDQYLVRTAVKLFNKF